MRAAPSRKLVVMIDSPAGAVNAALTPLMKRAVVDDSAERRGDDEDGERRYEDAATAEQIGGAATEEQEPAVAEDVRAHDPLERARRHVQVGANRRKGDADHRHIECVEEERAAENEEHCPGPPVELCGPIRCRRVRHLPRVHGPRDPGPERGYPGIRTTRHSLDALRHTR